MGERSPRADGRSSRADGGDPPAVEARSVTKRYGETTALSEVSVSVARGEVFGLIGPNGAGKTTLVRALTGTASVDGTVQVLGAEPGAVARERIGLLPQSFAPPDRLTARELIAYYAGLYDEARDPDAVLADVGVDDAATTPYGSLSGGQRRRVCVGAALVNDPDLLFLDEPTTGIDPAGRRDVWGLLEALSDAGTTVFLTSHSMAEVQRLADRVALLRAGEVVAVGSPTELIADSGGPSRLLVEVGGVLNDGLIGAVDDRLGESRSVAAADGRLVVEGVAPAAIGDILDAVAAAGAEYDAVTWREPTLEDVYLRLTGESFDGQGSTVTAAGEGRR